MQSSKFSTNRLMTVLTLATIFVAGGFARHPAVAANVRAGTPVHRAMKPIPGIVITVKSPIGAVIKRIDYDDGGTFTVSGIEPGRYYVRVECKKCENLDIGKSRVRVTLTGTKEGRIERTISKQQLISGIEVTVNVTRRTVSGRVTLIK
ncbi:MAG: hypothetical protein H0W99_17230 [Acidobacteria bacterium]|nr:hypothetical protein [Acidobacteriota bacterium]